MDADGRRTKGGHAVSCVDLGHEVQSALLHPAYAKYRRLSLEIITITIPRYVSCAKRIPQVPAGLAWCLLVLDD